MIKIIYLTYPHLCNYIRIFIKRCRSLLAAHGYDVILVVADDDGDGDECKEGVGIIDVGRRPGQFNRIFKTTQQVFNKVVALDPDIYQLHDPEFIPISLKLKRLRKKVTFDSHEDVPNQFFNKSYLGPAILQKLSGAFSVFERFACHRFDCIITATPFFRDKFLEKLAYSGHQQLPLNW